MKRDIKYLLSILFLLIVSISLKSQSFFVNVGNVVVNNETVLSTENIINSEYAYFNLDGIIKVHNNFKNNAIKESAIFGIGTMEFCGYINQEISGSSNVFSLPNIIVNTMGIDLNNNIEILGNVEFRNGIVKIADFNNNFLFGEHATWNGGSDFSHIDGTASKVFSLNSNSFVFPVGDDGKYAQLELSNVEMDSPLPVFDVVYNKKTHFDWSNFDPYIFEAISQKEYWDVDLSNGSVRDLDITLYWNDGAYSGIGNISSLAIARYEETGWSEISRDFDREGDSISGNISDKNILPKLGSFTFASYNKDENPLPIELIYLSAHTGVENINLRWETATEINNDHFEIEKSVDGIIFNKIGEIGGHGNSSINNFYTYTDFNIDFNILYYYRLKQVDYNENFKYSSIVKAVLNKEIDFSIYPNPASEWIEINIDAEILGLNIINELGQIVYSGYNERYINLSMLNSGMYILRLNIGNEILNKKFIVKK